jgi:hypothetical protein
MSRVPDRLLPRQLGAYRGRGTTVRPSFRGFHKSNGSLSQSGFTRYDRHLPWRQVAMAADLAVLGEACRRGVRYPQGRLSQVRLNARILDSRDRSSSVRQRQHET